MVGARICRWCFYLLMMVFGILVLWVALSAVLRLLPHATVVFLITATVLLVVPFGTVSTTSMLSVARTAARAIPDAVDPETTASRRAVFFIYITAALSALSLVTSLLALVFKGAVVLGA